MAVGLTVSGTDALARLLLREHGVTEANATLFNLPVGGARQALADGTADLASFVCSCDAPVVRELVHDSRVRLVSPGGQAGMARRFPYLRPAVLPEGALDLGARPAARGHAAVGPRRGPGRARRPAPARSSRC